MALLLLPVFSQPRSGEQPRIEGRVVNAVTGEPVRKAILSLHRLDRPGGTARAVSSAEGRFVFDNLEPGGYRLSAERAGFLHADYRPPGSGPQPEPLAVAPGRSALSLEFKLTPQAVITGRVVDEEGDPLPYVDVTILRQSGFGAARRFLKVDTVAANDVGEFRAAALEPGRYFLAADGQDASRAALTALTGEGPAEAYVTSFYPGTPDAGAAAPLAVRAGQELSGIEIRLRKTRVFTVKGKAAAGDATLGVQGVELVLAPRDEAERMGDLARWTAVTSAGGEFEFRNIPAGIYELAAIRRAGAARSLGRIPLAVTDQPLDDVVIPLSEGIHVLGSVRFEKGASPPLEGVTVGLEPAQGSSILPLTARIGEKGRFSFDAALPERYRLNFTALPEPAYVKAVRFNGEDASGKPVDLSRPAGGSATLEILLSGNGAEVEGRAMSGGNPAPAQLLLAPDPARPDQPYLYKRTRAGAGGHFRLTGIAPGEYRLYAWPEEVDFTDGAGQELAAAFERAATRLSVKESSREKVEVEVLHIEDARQ